MTSEFYRIKIILNGEDRELAVEPHETLLEVLRKRLGVKSPKCGCNQGECGSCTVILEGKSVRSCLILAVEVDGLEVTTIEGIARDRINYIQKALLEKNAFQCGFCAPGIIMSIMDLFSRNPEPDMDEIKLALSGNLCRCTGYAPILEAVHETGKDNCRCGDKGGGGE